MKKGEWADLVTPGAELSVRLTPGARQARLERLERADGAHLRAAVTAPPEGGAANAALTEALAHALGIAKTKIVLVRGQTSRQKVFRIQA